MPTRPGGRHATKNYGVGVIRCRDCGYGTKLLTARRGHGTERGQHVDHGHKSTLAPFEVFNHAIVPNPKGDGDNDRDDKMLWLSMQATRGSSDFYIVNNTWRPVDTTTNPAKVATTGWHSHPGHSLIVVTAGTLTDYESDDPECKPHVYTAGMSFVDSGGNHTHVIRNEGTIPASDIAVQLVPAGAARKIDAPIAPPNCPNIQ